MKKTSRKLLSMLLALVMVVSVMSVGAMAADTAPTNIAVYFCENPTSYSVHEVSGLTAGATVLDAAKAADADFDINDSTDGVWMYTINGELGTVAAKDYVLSSYDFVSFYKVSDYKTTSIVNPTTYSTVMDPSFTSMGRWCGVYFNYDPAESTTNGMLMNLDYSKSHKELTPVTATTLTVGSNKYLVLNAAAVEGQTRLPGCVPMIYGQVNVFGPRVNYMKTQALALANAINQNQLEKASSDALSAAITQLSGNSNLITMVDDMNSLMNVIAGLEYTTDTRLSYMEFSEELTVANAFFNYDFSYTSGDNTVTVPYSIKSASGTPTDIPSTFTIDFTPVSSAAKVTVSSTDSDVTVTKISDTSCTIAMDQAVVTDAKTVTLTVTVTNGAYSTDYTLNVQPTRYVSDTAAASIYAFLPAPGQFTNEYVTTGGWGDAYDANGVLKVNNSTGMSLGYFGGYVVYKFDKAVENKATNPYGADFIVYGNAFWGNSEPGCIQVSPDGENWYDIAGSRYYNDDTVKNYSLTYKNPNVDEDVSITKAGDDSTLAPVTFTGSASGTITTNSYHNHSWFPLNANYFAGRYGNAALDKVSELPFAERTLSNGVTDTLTLSGVKLSNVSTSDTAGYSFGYCDVHPNKELGGSVAYNPYQSFTSSSDYSTKTEGTSGGDPIDISWAVNADGTPAGLDSIQYVRIYTGAAQMNGIFGEISTEALGVAACTGTGSGDTTTTPTVKVGSSTVVTSNMGTATKKVYSSTAKISVTSDAQYIYVNGTQVSSGDEVSISTPSGSTNYVQIITQNGTESPYVTVLKVTR